MPIFIIFFGKLIKKPINCKCQYKNVQKRENNYVQKEEYYMFSFSSSKCSNLSLILYDNPFILTIVE